MSNNEKFIDEKFIVETRLAEKKGKKLGLIIQENAVNTKHLQDKSVTLEKLSDDVIKAFEGKVVASRFGNDPNITISQKLLTDTINDLYGKIREINGEPPMGIFLTATPSYFIGVEGCDVRLEATSTSVMFDRVAFFVDDVQVEGAEAEDVYSLEATIHIPDTATVKCKASVLGVDYEAKKTIQRHNSFWLGAGKDYTEIMDASHIVPFENNRRGAYDITCEQGDHIIIIAGAALKDEFIRADLNGFEIPFHSDKVTIDGNDYWVMVSDNTYIAGTYNIDING